jgi:hypothetical protein
VSSRSSGRTAAAAVLGVVAVLFIVAAIMYLAIPAKSLPGFMGHVNASSGHHPLRMVGSLVAGIVFAAGAWVALAYKPKARVDDPAKESTPAGTNS